MSEKVYKEKMAEGRKYLSQMKYEEAVAAFEFALEEKPGGGNPVFLFTVQELPRENCGWLREFCVRVIRQQEVRGFQVCWKPVRQR